MKQVIGVTWWGVVGFIVLFGDVQLAGTFEACTTLDQVDQVDVDPHALLQAAQASLTYLDTYNKWRKQDEPMKRIVRGSVPISFEQTRETLAFLCTVLEEDAGKPPHQQRIRNPAFLAQHFTFRAWKVDNQFHTRTLPNQRPLIVPPGHVRLTSYVIFRAVGSLNRTDATPCALYAWEADTPPRLAKQAILAGALEGAAQARPLVWLSRQDFEEAQQQGSILVTFPDRSKRLLSVRQDNGTSYNKDKGREEQERYCYFHERAIFKDDELVVPSGLIGLVEGVTLAGNLELFGLGKLFALRCEHPTTHQRILKFALLTDTGGAFKGQANQFDLFVGFFDDRDALHRYVREQVPKHAHACVVTKKEGVLVQESPQTDRGA